MDDNSDIDAGDFKQWFDQTQRGEPAEVPCGTCNACCRAAYFIQVEPTDRDAINVIPESLLFPAPGRDPGHMIMGYNQAGACPMLRDDRCSIYQHRPQACREYDCRLFAAAGISAGGEEKADVNARVQRWRFSYSDPGDKLIHEAITRAGFFLHNETHRFDAGLVPTNPTQLALLAMRIHHLFVAADQEDAQQLADQVSQIIRAT